MGYSTKRSNRHFLRAMLSRSISSVNHTTVRHEFSIPTLSSLENGRWARGLRRNINPYHLPAGPVCIRIPKDDEIKTWNMP